MKIYYWLFVPFIISEIVCARAANPRAEEKYQTGDRIEMLSTSDGRTWNSASIVRIEPDCVTISFEGGIAKVALDKLDSKLQERFGYDEQKARAYRASQEQLARQAFEGRADNSTQTPSLPENKATQAALNAMDEAAKKREEERKKGEERRKATYEEIRNKQIAEENSAAQKREEANENMKERIAEGKKKKEKKKKKKE